MPRLAVLAVLGAVAAGLWWRRGRPGRLVRALDPRPGERILAVGPGAEAVAVARRLAPGGTLELLGEDRAALDRVLRHAVDQGVEGIVATQGDPRALPFADASFDRAYVLGPTGEAVPAELRRVVRPGGEVVARPGGPLD